MAAQLELRSDTKEGASLGKVYEEDEDDDEDENLPPQISRGTRAGTPKGDARRVLVPHGSLFYSS